MNKIKFSHNWNLKLNNNIFTTIRKSNPEKSQYYYEAMSCDFEVILSRGNKDIRPDKSFGIARLIEVEKRKFKDIPLSLLHLDTGILNIYEIEDLFKKFGIQREDEVLIFTFMRLK